MCPYGGAVSATSYTQAENRWTWAGRAHGHRWTGPLYLTWDLWGDAITDDYQPDETTAHELLRYWLSSLPDRSTESAFGPGAVGVSWYVTGEPFEAAPFQMRQHRADPDDFLTYYTWPEHPDSHEQVNFNKLPVQDRLWRPGRYDKGGFFQEVTGWKPAPLQPVVWVGPTLAAARLKGPEWRPRLLGSASA